MYASQVHPCLGREFVILGNCSKMEFGKDLGLLHVWLVCTGKKSDTHLFRCKQESSDPWIRAISWWFHMIWRKEPCFSIRIFQAGCTGSGNTVQQHLCVFVTLLFHQNVSWVETKQFIVLRKCHFCHWLGFTGQVTWNWPWLPSAQGWFATPGTTRCTCFFSPSDATVYLTQGPSCIGWAMPLPCNTSEYQEPAREIDRKSISGAFVSSVELVCYQNIDAGTHRPQGTRRRHIYDCAWKLWDLQTWERKSH